jgi:hypothetical protein
LTVDTINDSGAGEVKLDSILKLDRTTLTISSGVITATRSYHLIAGEGGMADDLVTINGGETGDILVISASDDAVTITVKDDDGNIKLAGADTDFALDDLDDTLMLIFDGTNWLQIAQSGNS